MSTPQRVEPPPAVVLAVDDDPEVRRHVSRCLSAQGLKVETAESGTQALARCARGHIDLVLLDVVMPGMDGMECCRLLKRQAGNRCLPIVLLTMRTDTESRVDGFRTGADGYMCKPFDERELLYRVQAHLRFKHLHDDLALTMTDLEQLIVRDELTNLFNYRYLHTRCEHEFARSKRYRLPLSCIMLDVDHFKAINDEYGHCIGNEVLRELSARLLDSLREVDVLARYGGEEFAVLLPHTGIDGAMTAAQRMVAAVGGVPFTLGNRQLTVTVSAGVSAASQRCINSKDDLLKIADRALYRAKAQGRNRVERDDGAAGCTDSSRPCATGGL